MRNGLFPILLTLVILAIGFGVWFEGRNNGLFFRKVAEDLEICGTSSARDTLYIRWKYSGYDITRIDTWRNDDDILHIDVGISSSYSSDKVRLYIDTVNVRRLEVYGKIYDLKDISICN